MGVLGLGHEGQVLGLGLVPKSLLPSQIWEYSDTRQLWQAIWVDGGQH